jgi:hypothetical protein
MDHNPDADELKNAWFERSFLTSFAQLPLLSASYTIQRLSNLLGTATTRSGVGSTIDFP